MEMLTALFPRPMEILTAGPPFVPQTHGPAAEAEGGRVRAAVGASRGPEEFQGEEFLHGPSLQRRAGLLPGLQLPAAGAPSHRAGLPRASGQCMNTL